MEQINLNRPELWPQPTPFAARTMALSLAALAVVLGLLYGFQVYRMQARQGELERARTERTQVKERMARVQAAHKQRRRTLADLRREVGDLRQRAAAFREAERTLSRRLRAAGRKGEQVRALGRARAEQGGLWLTRFVLTGVAPVKLRLEGKALRPEAIPRYLQAVAGQRPFRGGFFRDFKAASPDGDSGHRDILSFHSESSFPVVGGEAARVSRGSGEGGS